MICRAGRAANATRVMGRLPLEIVQLAQVHAPPRLIVHTVCFVILTTLARAASNAPPIPVRRLVGTARNATVIARPTQYATRASFAASITLAVFAPSAMLRFLRLMTPA